MAGMDVLVKLTGLEEAGKKLEKSFQRSADTLETALAGLDRLDKIADKFEDAFEGIEDVKFNIKTETGGGAMDAIAGLVTKAVATLAVVSVVIGAVKDILEPILGQISLIIQLLVLPLAMVLQTLLKPVLVLVIIAIKFWTKLLGSIFKILTSFVLFLMRLFGVDTSKMDISDLSTDFMKVMFEGLDNFNAIMDNFTDTFVKEIDKWAAAPSEEEPAGGLGYGMFDLSKGGVIGYLGGKLLEGFKWPWESTEEGGGFKWPWEEGGGFKWPWDGLTITWPWDKGFKWPWDKGFKWPWEGTTFRWPWESESPKEGEKWPGQGEALGFRTTQANAWGEGEAFGFNTTLTSKPGMLDFLFGDGAVFGKGGEFETNFKKASDLVDVALFGTGIGFFAKGGMLETGFKLFAGDAYNILFSDDPDSFKSKLVSGWESIGSSLSNLFEMLRKATSGIVAIFNSLPKELRDRLIPIQDAIITPSGQIIKTDPADYIFATKNPGSLGGGTVNVTINNPRFESDSDMRRMLELLKREMASELKRGGNYATGY
jgi:hypothetical protein